MFSDWVLLEAAAFSEFFYEVLHSVLFCVKAGCAEDQERAQVYLRLLGQEGHDVSS